MSAILPRRCYPMIRARDAVKAGADPYQVWLEYEPLDPADAGDTFEEFMAALQRPLPFPPPESYG